MIRLPQIYFPQKINIESPEVGLNTQKGEITQPYNNKITQCFGFQLRYGKRKKTKVTTLNFFTKTH